MIKSFGLKKLAISWLNNLFQSDLNIEKKSEKSTKRYSL